MAIQLAGLYTYPVKSCAALATGEADVGVRGLIGDRRWMIVDGSGRFITGREQPRMVLIRAQRRLDGLLLSAPGLPELLVEFPPIDAERIGVTVWKDQVDAALAADVAHQWISQFMRSHCRLVYMDEPAHRPVDPRYAQPGDEVSFADGFPLLLISQSSLDSLNARLIHPVGMLRFRPNLVIDGVPEHAEDGWRKIRIAAIEFDLVKPCSRCGFTVVMPESGSLDPSGEPLRTLATYRRSDRGVTFGQNVIARGWGRLRVGDPVQVLG